MKHHNESCIWCHRNAFYKRPQDVSKACIRYIALRLRWNCICETGIWHPIDVILKLIWDISNIRLWNVVYLSICNCFVETGIGHPIDVILKLKCDISNIHFWDVAYLPFWNWNIWNVSATYLWQILPGGNRKLVRLFH